MATLNSPGVSVSVIDESFYGSASQGTVPFILIATAQDKLDSSSSAVAEGTKAKNAGKLYEITSQRELLMNFGNPTFYDVNGTSLHGYPLNEYGLLAAHSFLGTSNRAFVMRADIDLAQLNASSTPPKSKAADGTYWLKTDTLDPAIYEYVSGKWAKQNVYVATEYVITPTINPPSITDWSPVGVPSNYDYVVLAGTFPIFTLLEYLNPGAWLDGYHEKVASGIIDFIEIQNMVIKRNGTSWKWFCGAALGGGNQFNIAAYQYGDVYPIKRRDNVTANQTGDVWINTRENVYDLEKYSSTTDVFSDVTFPINVTFNEGLAYYKNLDRSPKDIQVGDVIAIAGDHFPIALINSDNIGGLSFFEWTGITYTEGSIEIAPDYELPGSTVFEFYFFEDSGYENISVTCDGDINAIINTINSDADVQAYGATCYYDSTKRKFVFDSINGKTYGISAAELGFEPIPYTMVGVTGWNPISTVASSSQPSTSGVDGTYWYNEDFKVDILKNDGLGNWVETSVAPAYAVYVQPAEPTTPSNRDIWIDTTQVAEYPVIQRYNSGTTSWDLVDNTDQTTPDGIVFADARVDPLTGSAIDPDAPDALVYPQGMMLFNTRYSTRNVKQYVVNKFPENAVGDRDRWVTISGLKPDGSPYMGQDAVYRVISVSMQAAIVANDAIRSEDIYFNLLAAPGYPELIDELITLNDDRKETGFIIGDCPFDLKPTTEGVVAWATNKNNAISNGRDGLLSANHNLAVYYPCGITTNVDGTEVAVPPSHMMLRTFAYNDQVAYQWFAPAGLQRGVISNATSVGYVSSEGEFIPVSLNDGIRDSLYLNNINPIRSMINRGVIAWGQKTRSPLSSSLDRINVARLVNYIRLQAPKIVEPFLFEQNDKVSRKSAKAVIDAMMSELVSLRGVYDWITVCDETNNTSARIDRNELWIDIALKPTKSIEFIYIPIRLKRTGDDLTI